MGQIWGTFVGFLEYALLQLSIFSGSTGIGIIIFTIIARLILLPLTLKSIRSSRKMQELQPMIKELQRKHGKDQKKLQEETIKLYQQYQINPLGGCLPMLLQLPIFIGVYWAVLHLMDPSYQEQLSPSVQALIAQDNVSQILARPFLGIIDLGQKPFEEGAFDFEHFNGAIYLILPILSIVLQFVQQLMAMPRVQDPQQKAMSQAMLFMPLFFAYITLIFPAGAVLYWVTSSVVGIIQQYFTSGWGSLANYLKFLPPDKKAKAQAQEQAQTESEDTPGLASSSVVALDTHPQRQGFWDIMSPLTEAVAEDTGKPQPQEQIITERPANNAPSRQDTTRPSGSRRSRRRRG